MNTLVSKVSQIVSKWNSEIILCTSLVLPVLVFFFEFYRKRFHLYKLASKIPGPRGWPLIGLLLDFTGSSDDIYDNLMKHFFFRPDLIKIWYGPKLVFGVSKPEYLETILTSPKALSKMYIYKFIEILTGHGLFTAPVPVWKRHRKIIMPAFNQKILEGFVEVFARNSSIMCNQLEKYIEKEEFDVIQPISRYTLETLCETAMGVKLDIQTEDSILANLVNRMAEIGFLRMTVPWYHFDFLFKWTKMNQEVIQLIEKYHTFTEEVLQERQHNYKSVSRNRKAFLDLLLELSSNEDTKLSEAEIRDEVNTFMIAGSDTTANTLSFFFVMLAMHPHIQEEVFQEVISVLGTEQTVEPQDLPLLKYTEGTIKETLRLFPVGPFMARDIDEDLILEDNVVLPKGSSALLAVMHVHRNGDIWPNPLKFDPDRFLPEEVAKRHPYAYIPFSGGPRNCIGSKYAMMAMKTTIATAVRKYKFKTSYQNVEDVKLTTSLMLRPREGYKISLESRKCPRNVLFA